ncbi:BRD4-interacting chromatin-remodeling complex-associated protein-like [Coregonus clupeaformis]|uniref:BRD4-interacting chromatin-remodeling complex-associated protein-like n=1 Tax=Coregonus clupeaformis TaxID=59861 RepID=UPI001BDF787A|nr:BRD4-interacting chromatin-remodeling complex-associated protein-like [Coregonus clupeaformis]
MIQSSILTCTMGLCLSGRKQVCCRDRGLVSVQGSPPLLLWTHRWALGPLPPSITVESSLGLAHPRGCSGLACPNSTLCTQSTVRAYSVSPPLIPDTAPRRSQSTTPATLARRDPPAAPRVRILQQIELDHARVLDPDLSPFTSLEDAAHRLLPYHGFQTKLPTQEELWRVDEEFEAEATEVMM